MSSLLQMVNLSQMLITILFYDGIQYTELPKGGGGTSTYGLYRYVPRNRVWFLRFSVLKQGIFFDPFVSVSLVWSLDRVA